MGVNSGGANGVFFVEIVDQLPNGNIIISNYTEGSRRVVDNVQAEVEANLVFPLLRGRDIKRWKAEPSLSIIITHEAGMKLKAIPESQLKVMHPKLFGYLKHFEEPLRQRSVYRR